VKRERKELVRRSNSRGYCLDLGGRFEVDVQLKILRLERDFIPYSGSSPSHE
jgi:hypothetical protein